MQLYAAGWIGLATGGSDDVPVKQGATRTRGLIGLGSNILIVHFCGLFLSILLK